MTPAPPSDVSGSDPIQLRSFRDASARIAVPDKAIEALPLDSLSILEVMPIPVAVNDIDLNVTYLNPAFIRLFGYHLSDIPTIQHWWPKAYPDPAYRAWVIAAWMQRVDAARAAGAPFEPIEVDIRTATGKVLTMRVSSEDLSNSPFGTHVVTFQDLTTQKALERSLRDRIEAHDDLYNNAPCGYHSLDRDGIYEQINDTELGWLGLSREEVVGKRHMTDFLTDDGRKTFARGFPKLKEQGRLDTIEFDLVAANGFRRRVGLSATTRQNADGSWSTRSISYDVSQLARARDQLAAALAEKNALLESGLIGIMTMRERTILWANTGTERIFGYSAEELTGAPARIAYRSDDEYQAFAAAAYPALRAGRMYRSETRFVRKDGQPVWLDVSGQMIDRATATVQWCFIDITARRHFQQSLEAHRANLESAIEMRTADLALALETADAANRAKSAFLATMSHELRTPLHSIMIMADLAMEHAVDDRQKEQLSVIAEAAGHQSSLVKSLLDLTLVESDRLALEAVPFRLDDILNKASRMTAAEFGRKSLRLSFEVANDLRDRTMTGDPLRLSQVLINLLENAAKFTERGAVTVRLREAGGTDASLLRLEVSDNGCGIPVQDQARIFAPFEQGDASLRRKHGGSGLGLAICRKLVRLMGGDIGVDSREGLGSTFWCTFRLAQAPDCDPR